MKTTQPKVIKKSKRGGRRPGAGRPKGTGKYGEPTRAVRVPERLVSDIKAWCKNLSAPNFIKGDVVPASEEDYETEYLAPIISIKIVADIDEAIEHINDYSSQHTDSIMTQDHNRAQRFLREVDSSSVMVNASTRFADGFEYGLGAEIGISTDKLHARGPVGLEGLTSQKFIVLGDGHIRR